MTPNISTTTTTTATKTTTTILIKPMTEKAADTNYLEPLIQLDKYILDHLNEIFQKEVFNPYFLMKISSIKQTFNRNAVVDQSVMATYIKELLCLLEEINAEYFEKIRNLEEYLICQRHYMNLINSSSINNNNNGASSASFKKELITKHILLLKNFHQSISDEDMLLQKIKSEIIIPSLLDDDHNNISTNRMFKKFMKEKLLITDIKSLNLNENDELLNQFEVYYQQQLQDGSAENSVMKFFSH